MLLIDAHLDLSPNAINHDRDLTLDVHELRRREAGMSGKFRGRGTVTLPEMRRADVGICIAEVICRTAWPGAPFRGVATQQIAYAVAQGQLAYYRQLEREGVARILTTAAEVDKHVQSWESDRANTPLGFVIAMEGADPIVSPAQVPLWWEDGLRIVSLTHYGPSAYAHGTASSGGLFPGGGDLLAEMERVGMILDLSHMADESFWEALDVFGGPVLASHNNCRALVPGDRQFSDDQIRAIGERGGVMGVSLDAWMLYPGWVKGVTSTEVLTMEAVIDQIDHICSVTGTARHAAVGSDLDGGFGTEQCPRDLDTIADLQAIPRLLSARGYSDQDVRAIMHGNWLRLLKEALP